MREGASGKTWRVFYYRCDAFLGNLCFYRFKKRLHKFYGDLTENRCSGIASRLHSAECMIV